MSAEKRGGMVGKPVFAGPARRSKTPAHVLAVRRQKARVKTMPSIGQYAKQKLANLIEDDLYSGVISHCEVVMDPTNPKVALVDQWDKNRLLIKVVLDGPVDDAGGPVELRRQLAISYGQSAGTYSALAQLIEAATGIKRGDKAQRHVTTEELVGKAIRVQTAVVEKDDRTFVNIVGFLAPKKPREAIRAMLQDDPDETIVSDDELPF
jgi:hypothetical protein